MSLPNLESELAEAKAKYDKEVPLVSTCCGAGLKMESFCLDCGENTVAEPAISFEDYLLEIK